MNVDFLRRYVWDLLEYHFDVTAYSSEFSNIESNYDFILSYFNSSVNLFAVIDVSSQSLQKLSSGTVFLLS